LPGNDRKSTAIRIQARDCFICGTENPAGLNIPFYFDGKTITAEYAPGAGLCGFDGIVHGGIVYSLADEAMMHLIWASGLRATSAEITMRYHNFAKTGELLKLRAEFVNVGPRLIKARCLMKNARDEKIATASGKFLPFAEGDEKVFSKRF
jgi:uncharacterized protein (TIGR00369 family)